MSQDPEKKVTISKLYYSCDICGEKMEFISQLNSKPIRYIHKCINGHKKINPRKNPDLILVTE